jgi:hypothetical protein
MKRKAGALALLAALGGCVSTEKTGPQPGQFGAVSQARQVAGVQGPWGEPVPVTAQSATPPAMTAKKATPADAKKAKGGVVQAAAAVPAGKKDSGVVTANAKMPAGKKDSGIVQTNGLMGPGVVAPPPGAVAAVGALPGIPVGGLGGMPGQPAARTSIRFTGPAGMQIAWFAPSPESRNGFTPAQVEVPGRYNFIQGGVYRLKLTNIPNRPALELYPTLEVYPNNARTCTFLAHSAVPVGFTEEDFEQVLSGNFVIKVIYLPDPQFQDLAVAGPDEVVSTRLEPGVDPILEATRRGSILCVIRIGNIDLEAPNTPSMIAPPAGGPLGGMPLMAPPGAVPPGMLPPGTMPGMLPPGTPVPNGTLPPGAVPLRPGQPMPGAPIPPPPPGAGRPSALSPAAPPGMMLPNRPGAALPKAPGGFTASVDGMAGRMK